MSPHVRPPPVDRVDFLAEGAPGELVAWEATEAFSWTWNGLRAEWQERAEYRAPRNGPGFPKICHSCEVFEKDSLVYSLHSLWVIVEVHTVKN